MLAFHLLTTNLIRDREDFAALKIGANHLNRHTTFSNAFIDCKGGRLELALAGKKGGENPYSDGRLAGWEAGEANIRRIGAGRSSTAIGGLIRYGVYSGSPMQLIIQLVIGLVFQ
jgi:hypothetical protein